MIRNPRMAGALAFGPLVVMGWLLVVSQVAPAAEHAQGEAAPAAGEKAAEAEMGRVAQAELQPLGDRDVSGTINFQEQGDLVRVSGVVRGLSPGKHGFHIHEGTSCDDRGGHFAPRGSPHGSPDAQQRHVGDLGNLAVGEDGEFAYLRLDRELALSGPHSIVGRVLVVHQGEDDYVSQPSGNAGEQIACGRIELETEGASARSAQPATGPVSR